MNEIVIKKILKKCQDNFDYITVLESSPTKFKLDKLKLDKSKYSSKPGGTILWLSAPKLEPNSWFFYAYHILPDWVDLTKNDIIGFKIKNNMIQSITNNRIPRGNKTKILGIHSKTALNAFSTKYSFSSNNDEFKDSIKWNEIGQEWIGVEFKPYYKDTKIRSSPKYFWYSTYDAESLVIWNNSAISKYKKCYTCPLKY